MFCPKCGANLPDEATFCSSCGSQMQKQEAQPEFNQQNQFEQPYQYDPAYQQPPMMHLSAKARGMKKKEFLATEASETARNMSKFSIIAFIVAAVLVISSVVVANNTAFYKLPIISTLVGMENEDALDEIEEELDADSEIFDDARDALDEFSDELDDDEVADIENFIDKAEAMAENPSLASITAAINQLDKISSIDIDGELEDRIDFDSFNSLDEVVNVLNGMMTATYIFAAIVVLLALLAYFKKSTGLAVTAAIIAAPFTLAFSGAVWYVLILASFVAMAVMFSKINKEYKA